MAPATSLGYTVMGTWNQDCSQGLNPDCAIGDAGSPTFRPKTHHGLTLNPLPHGSNLSCHSFLFSCRRNSDLTWV